MQCYRLLLSLVRNKLLLMRQFPVLNIIQVDQSFSILIPIVLVVIYIRNIILKVIKHVLRYKAIHGFKIYLKKKTKTILF
jgi:hypothetical protein